MNLTQKRYPFMRTEFEIRESIMHVRTKQPLTTTAFEVPLRELSAHPTEHRSFPLGWLVCAIGFGGLGLYFLFTYSLAFPDRDTLGATVGSLTFIGGALLCVHGFLIRKVDYVILHMEHTGQPIVYMDRRRPTEIHVKEFVEITKEHIEDARNETRG